jgi:putative tryptophan/tyrosine transport system substrate-binding protein
MRRRDFVIGGLTGGAASSFGARAEQALPVLGILSDSLQGLAMENLRTTIQGLSATGYNDGQNVAIEYRFSGGNFERLAELAADLVRRSPAVIVTNNGNVPARAAMAASRTIPILFSTGADPVATGLVASLNRPGGNVTGVSTFGQELTAKRLELLHEMIPLATMFGLFVNPNYPRLSWRLGVCHRPRKRRQAIGCRPLRAVRSRV